MFKTRRMRLLNLFNNFIWTLRKIIIDIFFRLPKFLFSEPETGLILFFFFAAIPVRFLGVPTRPPDAVPPEISTKIPRSQRYTFIVFLRDVIFIRSFAVALFVKTRARFKCTLKNFIYFVHAWCGKIIITHNIRRFSIITFFFFFLFLLIPFPSMEPHLWSAGHNTLFSGPEDPCTLCVCVCVYEISAQNGPRGLWQSSSGDWTRTDGRVQSIAIALNRSRAISRPRSWCILNVCVCLM